MGVTTGVDVGLGVGVTCVVEVGLGVAVTFTVLVGVGGGVGSSSSEPQPATGIIRAAINRSITESENILLRIKKLVLLFIIMPFLPYLELSHATSDLPAIHSN